MISIESAKKYCCEDISLIENYQEAINSPEKYDCHHRLELHPDNSIRYEQKTLEELDLYFNRPANELIFLKKGKHSSIHLSSRNQKYNSIPKSIFGKKFFERYNMIKSDNPRLYDKEQKFYHKRGYCSWEV